MNELIDDKTKYIAILKDLIGFNLEVFQILQCKCQKPVHIPATAELID